MIQVAIQLPAELENFVLKSVSSGDYATPEAMFISVLTSYKEQTEAPLTAEEDVKLSALRSDIQMAVSQAERGEVIRGFNADAFLGERHRERVAQQTA